LAAPRFGKNVWHTFTQFQGAKVSDQVPLRDNVKRRPRRGIHVGVSV